LTQTHIEVCPLYQVMNILVVDDYLPLQTSLVEALQKEGHHVTGIDSAEAFDDEAQDHNLDLVILDVSLPGEDGFSLAKRIHTVQPTIGIIMLTARSDAADKIKGYECGADIYLTKPVGFEELISAVNALARRLGMGMGNQAAPAYESDPEAIELRTAQSRIQGSQGSQDLTPTEFTLLMALARAKDKSLELWQIYDVLGKDEQTLQKSALEAQLYRLRKKLSDCGAGNQVLRALRLKGYRLYCSIYIK
jgi:DNA-binding response OmpR family regulator